MIGFRCGGLWRSRTEVGHFCNLEIHDHLEFLFFVKSSFWDGRFKWILENTKNGVQVSNGLNTLSISSDVPILRADIVDGWKSLFYMQKQSVPVLEVEIGSAGTISTEFSWAS